MINDVSCVRAIHDIIYRGMLCTCYTYIPVIHVLNICICIHIYVYICMYVYRYMYIFNTYKLYIIYKVYNICM